MKTEFFASQDFKYFAEVTKIALIDNAYYLKITSQWLGAKDPRSEQTQFQTTCTGEDLARLSSFIEQAIVKA
jgi:hypothetical protein